MEDRRLLTAVTSMTPEPGTVVVEGPTEITVTFDEAVDPDTVTNNTFSVQRSGGDGTFDDGNEVDVPADIVTAADGLSATLQFDEELRALGGFGGAPSDVVVVDDMAYVVDSAGLIQVHSRPLFRSGSAAPADKSTCYRSGPAVQPNRTNKMMMLRSPMAASAGNHT